MLGGLTQTFASHPSLLLIIPALIFMAGVILRTQHNLTVLELCRRLAGECGLWSRALEQVQDEQILSQPDVITHRPDEYDDISRARYEEAQKTWATWLAQRQTLSERVALAMQLQGQIQTNSWWTFSLRRLKKSAEMLTDGTVRFDIPPLPTAVGDNNATTVCEIAANEFLPAVTATAAAAREQAETFTRAFNAAGESLRRLNQAIDGSGSSRGLSGQKNKLVSLELPLAPYQDRLNAVLTTRDKLTLELRRQPLSNYSQAVSDLHNQISNLEKELALACSMQTRMLATAKVVKEISSGITSLRQSQVPSLLPGVEIGGCWTLDEKGYEPDPDIEEAERYSTEFSAALESGNLKILEKLDRSIREAAARASRILERTMAEKGCFEQKFAEITASSTEADLQADNTTRQACLASYSSQKWGEANAACETFLLLHKKRLAARDEGRNLLARLAEVESLCQQNVDVSSAECDRAYTQLTELVDQLIKETRQGAADWDVLRNKIVNAYQAKKPGGIESFLVRIKGEIDAHSTAIAAVQKLSADLQYTDEKTRDKWGGPDARTSLESVYAAIEEAIASAAAKKQDWNALKNRVEAAADLLAPARQMVLREVSRDQEEYQRLITLSGDIDACNQKPYTRTICGRVYGKGIYCPTTIPAQKLAAARDFYQQRRYDEMATALSAGRQVLIAMHLDAWWLCLQALAYAQDPCARQFALAEGYDSCNYDEWIKARTNSSVKGQLFNLSDIRCDKHQGHSFAEEVLGDAPNISDYASGALVSR